MKINAVMSIGNSKRQYLAKAKCLASNERTVSKASISNTEKIQA